MEIRPYCGGAAPSEEQRNPQPQALPLKKMYIKRGNMNKYPATIIDSIVTDSMGKFAVLLPAGDYCVVEATKKGKLIYPQNSEYAQWDTACYRKNYERCDYQLQVKGKTKDVQIILQRYCSYSTPCQHYEGPLPPMAHPPQVPQEKPKHQE